MVLTRQDASFISLLEEALWNVGDMVDMGQDGPVSFGCGAARGTQMGLAVACCRHEGMYGTSSFDACNFVGKNEISTE